MKIRDNLSDTEDELSSIGLDLILFLDLVESDGGVQVIPVGFGQFEEIIEDELEDLGHAPSIGEEFILEDFNFIGKDH